VDELREAWERDGCAVLRGAAPADAVAGYAADLANVHDGLLVRGPGDEHVSLAIHATTDHPTGAVDPYALSRAGRTLLLPERLTDFLTGLFGGDAPLLFDAAEATAGPLDAEGGPFRDATFVALAAEPETLITAAVALDAPATLTIWPGSQRIATTAFSGRYRHVNPERDGAAALPRHRDELAAALGDGAPSETITLAPGDVAVWSADLVHGPIEGAALIAHYCPARVQPSWFAYRPERARHAAYEDGRAWIASQHYDLVDAVTPESAPAGIEDPGEIARVADALHEHDQELAVEPPPGSPAGQDPDDDAAPHTPPPPGGAHRRSGGLVDSVRGLMNRRGRR
jgi:hypothetical protein